VRNDKFRPRTNKFRAVHLSPGRVEGAHLRRVKDVNYPLTGPSERFHSILIVGPTTHATNAIHSISQPFPNLSCIDQSMRAGGLLGRIRWRSNYSLSSYNHFYQNWALRREAAAEGIVKFGAMSDAHCFDALTPGKRNKVDIRQVRTYHLAHPEQPSE
jgi:hypothetical protein